MLGVAEMFFLSGAMSMACYMMIMGLVVCSKE